MAGSRSQWLVGAGAMYNIDEKRVIVGFGLAVVFAVAATSLSTGHVWAWYAVVGSVVAPLTVLIFLFPTYRLLKNIDQLKIWWAIALGAFAVNLPWLLMLVLGMLHNGSIFKLPFWAPYGAISALIGWVYAFGICIVPPRIKSDHA